VYAKIKYMQNEDKSERRQHPRCTIAGSYAELKPLQQEGKFLKATIQNISGGGVSLEIFSSKLNLLEQFHLKQRFILKIKLHFNMEMIETQANLRWMKKGDKIKDGYLYFIGLQFDEISDEYRLLIANYVSAILKSE